MQGCRDEECAALPAQWGPVSDILAGRHPCSYTTQQAAEIGWCLQQSVMVAAI